MVLEVTPEADPAAEGHEPGSVPGHDMLFEPLTAKDFKQLTAITAKLAGTGPRTLRLIEALAPEGVLPEFAPPPAPTRSRGSASEHQPAFGPTRRVSVPSPSIRPSSTSPGPTGPTPAGVP